MLYTSFYAIILFTVQLWMILDERLSAWWLLGVWIFLFVFLFRYRKRLSYPPDHPHVVNRRQMLTIWFVALIFLAVSHVYLQWHVQHQQQSPLTVLHKQTSLTMEEEVFVQGELTSPVETDGNRIRFSLDIETLEQEHTSSNMSGKEMPGKNVEALTQERTRYTLPKTESVILTRYAEDPRELTDYELLNRGDRWKGTVDLSFPGQARNPGAFDYRQYLARQGIHITGQISGHSWSDEEAGSFLQKTAGVLDQQRMQWLEQVERIFSVETAPIVQAMTMGERAHIDPHVMNLYQDLGLIHLLAISGLHVGVVLWLVYACLSRLPLTRETMYNCLFLFIPLYIYLSGVQVSVVRAGFMAMVVLLALRFRWGKNSLLGLFAVYIGTLLYDPYQLFQVGYQLSFSTTFALLAIYPAVKKTLHFLPDKVQPLLGIALVAQVVSVPFLIFHFYQFSPLSLMLNVLLVPLYSLFYIPAGFGLTLLSFLSTEVVQLGIWLYEQSLQWLHVSLQWVEGFPWAILYTGLPSWWWFFLYAGVVFLWVLCADMHKRMLAWWSLALLAVVMSLQLLLPYWDERAYVMMLDVGQAESIVIELPFREEVILIDAGNELAFPAPDWQEPHRAHEAGQDVLLPYLRYRGIQHVDKVVISHGHYDHLAGLENLLGKVSIDQVLRSQALPQSDFEQEMLEQINEHKIPIYGLGRGDEWKTDHTHFHVVYPESEEYWVEHVQHVHDVNLALWSQIYGTTFLWTGDMEENGEKEVVEHYPRLPVDVLKVGHHGSNTSSSDTFLEHVQPRVSMMSLGRNNLYGHPHPEVISRLEEIRTMTFRTDQHGGIRIIVDEEGWQAEQTLQADQEWVQ